MAFEQQLLTYKAAFSEEHLYGGCDLAKYDDMLDWLRHTERLSNKETCDKGSSPSSTFLCIRQSDQKIVGICNIRHDLNQDFFLNIAGHIGYSICPSERGKGYGQQQLALALQEAKKLGLNKVLVTCADWNKGSERTILANGGIYEDSRLNKKDGFYMKRYWIENN
nr:GNAT family N-acetyltransferase [Streptococcus oricebi]